MNKVVSAGIGIGIGLIALAFIIMTPAENDIIHDEPAMQVQLDDRIEIEAEESKSFEIDISEGLKVGDGSP